MLLLLVRSSTPALNSKRYKSATQSKPQKAQSHIHMLAYIDYILFYRYFIYTHKTVNTSLYVGKLITIENGKKRIPQFLS